jgi:hypothetical protein
MLPSKLLSKACLVAQLALFVLCASASASNLVNGVVLNQVANASVADQNAIIAQLKQAGVRVVRIGLKPNDAEVNFAKRLYDQGIKIELLVGPQYPPNAPTRPYQPKAFPDMWSGHPLSSADPELSRAGFQAILGKLEANGIVLEALEFGNEYNWAPFNAEFPLPGEGKNFGLHDLYHDPEGKQIAKGFLQYLKVLAVLKEVRDQSKLNQRTPIISVGLADDGPEKVWANSKVSGVSLNASIEFMQANGLDNLVDYYGIHTYPSESTNPAARKSALEMYAVHECRPAASKVGKPCWITEWGFNNKDASCPVNDTARAALVREMMGDFRELAKEGRLVGIMYFVWNSEPHSKTIDPRSIYRCGALTESGKIVVSP